MTWIPSDYANYGGCENLSNCDENIVCYKLQYTPVVDGVITSYTTGFFADCMYGETAVLENESCIMADNSRQTEACHQVGKILMNSSGNSGGGALCVLEANVPIILHQVCFQVPDGTHVAIDEDEKTDLTVSVDIDGTVVGITEFPNYQRYLTKNEYICDQNLDDIYIHARKKEQRVSILHWTPIRETGSGLYTIERSVDGVTFDALETVKDAGFNPHELTYELVDPNAEFGYNFYRVKYTDGLKVEISNIGFVYHYDGHFSIDLYPNPARNNLQLAVNSPFQNINWTILDETGKPILAGQGDSLKSNINVQALPAGAYFLTVRSGELETSEKFLKID